MIQPKINDSGTLRILYAEDMLMNQKLMELICLNPGHEIELVKDGVVVIEKFKPDEYDVILMDISMPNMDGIETMRYLHKNYPDSVPPIIAVTALAGDDESERFIKMGMDGFIAKSVTFSKIAPELNAVKMKVIAKSHQYIK